ncbi:exosortase 2 [Leptothrix cholodnii SP-6]|uniref:Exosortase 2 n=1 Tax=Leptothrix cholodnii (strain ATCC 51168 / LMG 8142 / SP-6) TaxID=395495 RepID=B1Y4Q4_LEPCP|nr:exosortase 2 [Leptothrix cholodnii SP-6]
MSHAVSQPIQDSTTPEPEAALQPQAAAVPLTPWLIAGAGLLAMYVPTFWDLMHGIWSTDQQGHGPIVLGIGLWLLWRKWPDVRALPSQPARGVGWPVFVIGLLLYLVGRSQDILLFEVGALIWLIAAVTLLLSGARAMKHLWFGLFFLLFMIPLPGVVVDALTQPMKLAVSYVAEFVLHGVGYPISRTGVVLQVGQYQLLVADACAGLHTLFTLEALGLLYLNLVRHESVARNVALATLIVPISFTANVIRVMVLTLITYHFGDEAGQGFLHGFAGMVLFMAALLLIIGTDSVLRWLLASRTNAAPSQAA